MSSVDPHNQESELLYQKHPRGKSQFPGLRSKTESKQSYRKDALHEYGRLKVNGTIPNHIIQVNYKTKLTKERVQELWKSTPVGCEGQVSSHGLD